MATHLHSKNHWSTYNLWSEEVGSWIFAKPWKRNKKIIRLTWKIGKDFGLYSSSFFSMKNHFKILYWLSHLYNSFNTLTFTIFTVYAHFDYKLIVNICFKQKFQCFVIFKPYHTFHKYTSYFSDSHTQPFEMSRDWGTPRYCFHKLAYYPHYLHSHSNTEDICTANFFHYLMEYIYHKNGMSYSGRGLSYPQDKHSTP